MARLKKVRGIRVGTCAVNIYRNAEFDEYVVKSVVEGQVEGGHTGGYYTTNKKDARDTAATLVRRLRGMPKCKPNPFRHWAESVRRSWNRV